MSNIIYRVEDGHGACLEIRTRGGSVVLIGIDPTGVPHGDDEFIDRRPDTEAGRAELVRIANDMMLDDSLPPCTSKKVGSINGRQYPYDCGQCDNCKRSIATIKRQFESRLKAGPG